MDVRSVMLVAVLFCGPWVSPGDALADAVAVPAPMQYYLTGIEAPFGAVTTLIELRRLCEQKFPGECRDLTTDRISSLQHEAELLGAISLFSVPRGRYRPEQFSSPREMARALDSQKPLLIAELKKFDLKFLGRFGATAEVCPSTRQQSYVTTLTKLVLHRYWHMDDSERTAALADIDAIRSEYVTKLKDDFSPDACVQIGKQGRLLMEVFKLRFKEYKLDSKERWELLTVDQQLVGGAAFLWDWVVKMEADIGNPPFVEFLAEPSVQK